MLDQDQLVTRLRSRDDTSLAYLYDHYHAAIYGIILRIVVDEEIANEVLQDAFLKFWDKIGQYDPSKGRLFTWMANLTRNLAIDKLRSKEMKNSEKTDPLEAFVSDSDGPGQNDQQVDGIGLSEVLKALREEERFILEVAYFKGYTHSEISEEYQIPIGTVKTRMRMALLNMRKLLKVQ